ncbi:PIG-L deacetylase family protein [Sporohalobacter salinus]|uniref:PIG-L deacetylase family protein n=1 Tax=Sporohalobacter salinus TaxID=1494606 RepID=UPI0019609384|nr:PIG-L family deacetylase [Sporohalobacter salinus]MBM7623178.1 LmbE family N-acetylglucosaminyl deacetylase [Sporohalobacter salinus]
MKEIKLNEASDQIIILAPHCDDELLSCGGLIQEALAKDINCQIIFLTNGDSFRWAAVRNFRHPFLSHQKFQEFGKIRQQEAIKALKNLGLNNKNIYFLGYPDRGLKFLWSDYWHNENTYFSRYTGSMTNPYELTYKPARPYTGKNLVEDLAKIISLEEPTKIFISSSFDDHSDHWASYNFLHYALAKLNLNNKLVNNPEIYQYLTHKGSWPLSTKEDILPPRELNNENINWIYFNLNSKQQTTKLTALKKYKSQLKVTKKYLLSFITNNEIFIEDSIKKIKLPTNQKTRSKTLDYQEPINNNKKLKRRPGGDIKRIKLKLQQQNQLNLKLITKNKYSHHYSFRIKFYILLNSRVKQPRKAIDFIIKPAKNNNQIPMKILPTKTDQSSYKQVNLKENKKDNVIETNIATPSLTSDGYLFFNAKSYFKNKLLDSITWKVVTLIP